MMAFAFVLQATVAASLFALLVILIRPLVRKFLPHSLMSVLWGLVFICFVLPLILPMGLTFHLSHSERTVGAAEALLSGSINYTVLGSQGMAGETMLPLLQAIWIFGSLVFIAYFLAQRIRLDRYFSAALPYDAGKFQVHLHGIKRKVKIYKSAQVKTPITYGVFSPKIILPLDFADMDEELAEHAIIHEMRHIRCFDSLTNMMWLALICVHWFNPLAWLCWSLIKEDMEFNCDAAVVESLGFGKKADYARALVELMPVQNMRRSILSPLSSPNIRERIISIMRLKKPSVFSKLAALALIIAISPIFIISLTAAALPNTATSTVMVVYYGDANNEIASLPHAATPTVMVYYDDANDGTAYGSFVTISIYQ